MTKRVSRIGLIEPEPISRKEFNSYLDNTLFWKCIKQYKIRPYYTYIAKGAGCDVYKIGRSRNPISRMDYFGGDYAKFGFRVTHFLEIDIENPLLNALHFSGAKYAVPEKNSHAPMEAFYLTHEDYHYILNRFGFIPISNFYAEK